MIAIMKNSPIKMMFVSMFINSIYIELIGSGNAKAE